MAKARGKHYQLACAIAFEGVTGAPHDAGINRPSDYYAASVEAAAAAAAQQAGKQQQQGVGAGGGEGAAVAATPMAAGRSGSRLMLPPVTPGTAHVGGGQQTQATNGTMQQRDEGPTPHRSVPPKSQV